MLPLESVSVWPFADGHKFAADEALELGVAVEDVCVIEEVVVVTVVVAFTKL